MPLYDKGRDKFLRGELAWRSSGGHTFRVMLVDSALYTPDLAAHEFLSDVPMLARKGNAGGNGRTDGAELTTLNAGAGVADANDVTLTAIPVGGALEYLLIYRDDGAADASSALVALLDQAEIAGLPVTPNGQSITVTWDNGANKIFKL